MSAETIIGISLLALIVAKGLLLIWVFSVMVEENYRREMWAHGFDPGPLPWWIPKSRSTKAGRPRRRRLPSLRRRA